MPNFDVSKIFEIVPSSYVKFDEKRDGDVTEHVRNTFSNYA